MRHTWFRFSSAMSFYRTRYTKALRRIYWSGLILLVSAIISIPIVMGIINPDVRLPDFSGPPTHLMSEWNRSVALAAREQSRINDFVFMANHIYDNYPFLALVEEHLGIHYMALTTEAFDVLIEEALHDVSSGFFANFLYERYLSLLGGFGGLHLTGAVGGGTFTLGVAALGAWITQPYFFGYYDWRFTDDRFELYIRNENFTTETLMPGVAYKRIYSFLAKGYEPITRVPFWYYQFDTEKQRILVFYQSIAEYEHLVIDIRGIGNGFSKYFLPMILEPNIQTPVTVQFNAYHTDGEFANRVSRYFRDWYGIGNVSPTMRNGQFVNSFPIYIEAIPDANAFNGQVWLLADTGSFSGANNMYLQMALDAGFNIIYEENAQAEGWGTSFVRLPHSGLTLRYNPLLFTDSYGRPLVIYGAQPTHQLRGDYDVLNEVLSIISAD